MKLYVTVKESFSHDLDEILLYIATDNLDAAIDLSFAVEESLNTLAAHPLIGSIRHFADTRITTLRTWPVKGYKNYLIFYSVDDEKIDFLRIINTSRDFNLIFQL